MERMIMTRHAVEDRMDRLVFIAENIGWGTPVVKHKGRSNKMEIITTTGVCLIKSLDETVLVTAYPTSIDQVWKIYDDLYGTTAAVPSWLKAQIKKNEKIFKKFSKKH